MKETKCSGRRRSVSLRRWTTAHASTTRRSKQIRISTSARRTESRPTGKHTTDGALSASRSIHRVGHTAAGLGSRVTERAVVGRRSVSSADRGEVERGDDGRMMDALGREMNDRPAICAPAVPVCARFNRSCIDRRRSRMTHYTRRRRSLHFA